MYDSSSPSACSIINRFVSLWLRFHLLIIISLIQIWKHNSFVYTPHLDVVVACMCSCLITCLDGFFFKFYMQIFYFRFQLKCDSFCVNKIHTFRALRVSRINATRVTHYTCMSMSMFSLMFILFACAGSIHMSFAIRLIRFDFLTQKTTRCICFCLCCRLCIIFFLFKFVS